MREGEIKEVIEYFEGALKNADEFLLRGISCKIMVKQKARLELVIPILRAELSRQENAPLTCGDKPTNGIMLCMDGRENTPINIKINGKWFTSSAIHYCELLKMSQEYDPFTCVGCKREKDVYEEAFCMENCIRYYKWKIDRYEPKGENE